MKIVRHIASKKRCLVWKKDEYDYWVWGLLDVYNFWNWKKYTTCNVFAYSKKGFE